MSEKKAELDILGESHIPSGLLTPTLGSNYGLDGYPDMDYGMGTLDGVLDPDFMESPALPTGLSINAAMDDEDGMDLTAMLMEDSLADLSWLDPTQFQDTERLPEKLTSIPELEEAWGVHRRTDGMNVFARDLEQARYEEGATAPKKATARSLEKVISRAMRRSAKGEDIDSILKEAVLRLGDQMRRVASALFLVKDEHGLAGNVFIRAAAYPGYGQGKWREHDQRHAKSARYVIVSPKEMKASWIQDGRCIYTKKRAVTEVPWRDSTSRPKHDPSQREGFLAEGGGERKVYDKQASRVEKGVEKVAEAIKRGAYGDYLKSLIRKSFRTEDMKTAVKALKPLLQKTGALDRKPVQKSDYLGPEFRAHSMARGPPSSTTGLRTRFSPRSRLPSRNFVRPTRADRASSTLMPVPMRPAGA